MVNKAQIINANKFADDRGFITFCNDFQFNYIKRFYMVENHENNFIRAWHGHEKEGKYVHVISGTALFGVVSLSESTGLADLVDKFVLSEHVPKLLYIPPFNFNGFKNLEKNTKIMIYSTSTVEESMDDDIRKDYDFWNIWERNYR